ncbi:MAG TPA: ABC transporter ATP-binding protein, partial [Phycisphaerales bacterium]|nr:ABC transporter ATP-binding protein [Phycisphaerales bacterium]
PDMGTVTLASDLKIGYLPQEPTFDGQKTVLEEMYDGMAETLTMLRRIEHLAEQMAHSDGQDLASVMNEYDHLCHAVEVSGGYGYEARIKSTLAGLGFGPELYDTPTSALSGGQVSRLGLAKVLVQNTNCLLLDEPTNHLDLQAASWLEGYLRAYPGAVILISHDRYLLDRVAEKIVELEHKTARVWKGNYSQFLATKEAVNLTQEREYKKRTEMVERTLDFIARNKDKEGMRKTARGRKTRLNRMLKENPDFLQKTSKNKTIHFSFAESQSKTDLVLRVEDISKRFDNLTLFENLSFELTNGQRLGITGPNGTGKTTLLRLILGQLSPDNGLVRLGRSIKVGYLDQHALSLDVENTVLDEARTARPELLPEAIRSRLGAFLFSGEEVFKRVGDLSGGQQSRLMLCKLVLQEPDLLILDEPTNHLDIPSRELLEQALLDFNGTIIAVSHDRYFLDQVAEELLVIGVDRYGQKRLGHVEITPSVFPESNGIYSTYIQILEQRKAADLCRAETAKTTETSRESKNAAPKHLKAFNKYTLEQIEQTIACLEEKQEQLNALFGDESVYQNPDRLSQIKQEIKSLKNDLSLWYEAWEYRLG